MKMPKKVLKTQIEDWKRTAEEYRQEVLRLEAVNERMMERLDYATATTMAEAPIRRTPNMRMVRADVNGMNLSAILPDDDEAIIVWYRDLIMPQLEGLYPPNRRVTFEETLLVGREIQ
jgi:hypothetical protein